MQVVRSFEQSVHAMVGRAVRVLLVSSEGDSGVTGRRLAALGAKVDAVEEIYTALSELIDDPMGYALLVVDCDRCNLCGLQAGLHAVRTLGEIAQRVSVVLISSECQEQRFPADKAAPVVLRAPVSAVSLKVGYEHALRDRFLYQAA
jgi:hypothetical protein